MSELVVVDSVNVTLCVESSGKGLESITEANENLETRAVEAVDGDRFPEESESPMKMGARTHALTSGTKESRWKLAFRQLMFMKRMNMQFNDRTKNEIELRQQNITVRVGCDR